MCDSVVPVPRDPEMAAALDAAAARLAAARAEQRAASESAARLTVRARAQGWPQEAISARLGVTAKTVRAWLAADAHR